MITPKDIQNRQFSRGVRGYREDEVDTFLDMMTLEFEKLYKENKSLSEDVTYLERELEKYRGAENEVAKTMQQAQKLMSDISESAEKRAEIIVRNAELDADATMHEARERVQMLEEENKHLQDRYIAFRNRYKKMLEDELMRFETVTDDIFPDFHENKLEEILAEEDLGADASDTSVPAAGTNSTVILDGLKENQTSQFPNQSGIDSKDGMDKKTVVMNVKDLEDIRDK